MAYIDHFGDLELKGITELNRNELGRGAYGRVYTVKYCQTTCAAKEIHSILVEGVGQVEMQHTIESFMSECLQCSRLRHPNVIQFLGVYYPNKAGGANRMRLPVMVMEMMADSLISFVEKHEKIPGHIKYSIVYDVSLGLCYLHNHDPPIVHRDLSPNNILLTAHYVAKISDLGVAKVIKADSRKTMTTAPGNVDFMPLEALANNPVYGPPVDVFSFAGIILHTFNQQWPRPTESIQFNPKTRKRVALSEVERRQQYLDKMTGEATELRPLVEECLDDDPAVRPTIAAVCGRIQVNKDAYMKHFPQDFITLHQQIEQLQNENEQKSTMIKQQKVTIEQQRVTIEQQSVTIEQMSSAGSILVQPVRNGGGSTSELRIEAPPLIPALTSGRYQIKWTQLASLPVPLYFTYAAVQHHKVYVTGNSPVEDAIHQVYVYNINTDHWGQLPPSGHYFGIPHIIGGKLAIIGGRLSDTKRRTNKVSTFDEDNKTWTSYYPDLLSVRSKPGVVSYLKYVIVAGGTSSTAEDDGEEGNDTPAVLDDIEVLNWTENFCWRKVPIKLPVPMCLFTPTISDNDVVIVGYVGADMKTNKSAYKMQITVLIDLLNSGTSTDWVSLTTADQYYAAVFTSSSLPVMVAGGEDILNTTTADIKMYDDTEKLWKKIGSLSSARSSAAVTAVYNNAVIAIGGYTNAGNMANTMATSMTTVELGQAELLQ